MTPEQKALDEIYERLCRLETMLRNATRGSPALDRAVERDILGSIEACKWRKQPEHGQRYGHFGQLREMIDGVLPIERDEEGLLCTRFADGTRLSFMCGEGGRLLGVVIQRETETIGTTAMLREGSGDELARWAEEMPPGDPVRVWTGFRWPPAALRPDALGQLYNEAYAEARLRDDPPEDAHQAGCFALHKHGYEYVMGVSPTRATRKHVSEGTDDLCTCTDGRCLSVETKALVNWRRVDAVDDQVSNLAQPDTQDSHEENES